LSVTQLPNCHSHSAFQLLQHFVSASQIHDTNLNLFPLLLQQFNVGQTSQWQEKEEKIDKLFFPELPPLLLFSQQEECTPELCHVLHEDGVGFRFATYCMTIPGQLEWDFG
jgi:hypothetical protein